MNASLPTSPQTLQAEKVAAWLLEKGVDHAQAVAVVIGRTTYAGAYYRSKDREAYYLLGDLPASYRRSRKTAYAHAIDAGTRWYVASWYPLFPGEITAAEESRFHPFGACFQFFADPHQRVTSDGDISRLVLMDTFTVSGGALPHEERHQRHEEMQRHIRRVNAR